MNLRQVKSSTGLETGSSALAGASCSSNSAQVVNVPDAGRASGLLAKTNPEDRGTGSGGLVLEDRELTKQSNLYDGELLSLY